MSLSRTTKTVREMVQTPGGDLDCGCPLPLSVIPNYMGINLCAVESLTWVRQEDGQLTELTINFIPGSNEHERH